MIGQICINCTTFPYWWQNHCLSFGSHEQRWPMMSVGIWNHMGPKHISAVGSSSWSWSRSSWSWSHCSWSRLLDLQLAVRASSSPPNLIKPIGSYEKDHQALSAEGIPPCWSEIHADFWRLSQRTLHWPEGPSILCGSDETHAHRARDCCDVEETVCCENKSRDVPRDPITHSKASMGMFAPVLGGKLFMVVILGECRKDALVVPV